MEKGYVRMLYMETPNKPKQAYFVTKEGLAHLEEFKRDPERPSNGMEGAASA